MVGAACEFCEAFICHSKKCLTIHPCVCPLRDARCAECKRDVCEHGGQMYQCVFYENFLCEDDEIEHQTNCQHLDTENFKCMSCNRFGIYTCMHYKICCCDDYVRRKGFKYDKDLKNLPCPKCGYPTSETKEYSISECRHVYVRRTRAFQKNDGNEMAGKSNEYNKNGDFKYIIYDNESDDDSNNNDFTKKKK